MPYPESYSSMIDLISQKLQDTGNAIWTDTELALYIAEGLREISQYHPYIYKGEFNLESRQGKATSDVASALVDTTNSQFLSSDVGKWVFNVDDRTWAQVTAYVSTSRLTLSKDIFPDGNENYRMFNKGCTDSKEINLEATQSADGALGTRLLDWLYIDRIEYPILDDPPSYLKPGEFEFQERNIIRLKIDDEPPDTSESDAADEVWVYFALQHQLSQLTTLLGKIDFGAGYAAGSTTIHVDDLQSSGTLYKGQLFKIDGVRGIYVADYQRSIASNETDISFWPPLADAVVDDVTVRFISNTMDQKLEGIFADLVAGKTAMHKARTYINKVNIAGRQVWKDIMQWGQVKYSSAIAELENLRGFEVPFVDLP